MSQPWRLLTYFWRLSEDFWNTSEYCLMTCDDFWRLLMTSECVFGDCWWESKIQNRKSKILSWGLYVR
jgi:hypothetical protein